MGLTHSLTLVLAAALALPAGNAAAGSNANPQPRWQDKVDPWVLDKAGQGAAEFLVFLAEQADLSAADKLSTKEEKGAFAFERLRDTAARTQGPLLADLVSVGVEHQAFWVANMVWVKGDLALVER